MKKALIALALLALPTMAGAEPTPPPELIPVLEGLLAWQESREQAEWAVGRGEIKPAFVDIIPPPKYDRPYRGKLTVTTARDQAHVRELCPNAPFVAGYPTLACTMRSWDGKTCHMVLAPDADIWEAGFTVAVIRRHEIAHCDGWPGDHPGVRDWAPAFRTPTTGPVQYDPNAGLVPANPDATPDNTDTPTGASDGRGTVRADEAPPPMKVVSPAPSAPPMKVIH